MRAKCAKTVTIFKEQKTTLLWLASSEAQSAAKAILSYGQQLLDLKDHAHTGFDRPNGQKRRIELEEETESFKRICTSATAGFQNSSPNTHQNAIISQPGFQTGSLSLRANQTISQSRLHNESPNISANLAVFQAGLRDNPIDLQSNRQGLETLAQVALTNVPSEEATCDTNFISNEDTIHSESASYRENAPSNGASNQSRSDLCTEINNLGPSQSNDNPPLETNDDIHNLSSYQDNITTGDFHEQGDTSWQARAVEENDYVNWESFFTLLEDFYSSTATVD